MNPINESPFNGEWITYGIKHQLKNAEVIAMEKKECHCVMLFLCSTSLLFQKLKKIKK